MQIEPQHIREVSGEHGPDFNLEQLAAPEGPSFFERLGQAVTQMAAPIAGGQQKMEAFGRGQEGELHETLLAVDKSDIALKYMVTLRNRGLEAYREVMRMGS